MRDAADLLHKGQLHHEQLRRKKNQSMENTMFGQGGRNVKKSKGQVLLSKDERVRPPLINGIFLSLVVITSLTNLGDKFFQVSYS